MPFVKGYLEEKIIAEPGRPSHPIAPGGTTPPWGIEGPVDPGYGYPLPPVINGGPPLYPDQGLPPVHGRPSHPIQPTYPVDPDYGLPVAPGIWPQPPITTWPPPTPVHPSHPIYPSGGHPSHGLPPAPARPDQGLPPSGEHPEHPIELPPGSVYPPLPPSIQGPILCFVWVVGVGYRWVSIDPSLTPSHPIRMPGHPDQGLPPTPQPKK
jgi:hypothetical protein